MGDLSELHNCEKCQGHIVAITQDLLGVTRCAYCNEVVDYLSWFKKEQLDMMVSFIRANLEKLPDGIEVFIGYHGNVYEAVFIAACGHHDGACGALYSFGGELRSKFPAFEVNVSVQCDRENIWPSINYVNAGKK